MDQTPKLKLTRNPLKKEKTKSWHWQKESRKLHGIFNSQNNASIQLSNKQNYNFKKHSRKLIYSFSGKKNNLFQVNGKWKRKRDNAPKNKTF